MSRTEWKEFQVIQGEFVAPFAQKAKDAKYRTRLLKGHYRKAGVYIIKEEGTIVYVGMSEFCVTEAMYRHFYEWSPHRHTKQRRVTYVNELEHKEYSCSIIQTPKEQAHLLERALILSIRPRDNDKMYEGYLEELITERGYTKPEPAVQESEIDTLTNDDDDGINDDLPF